MSHPSSEKEPISQESPLIRNLFIVIDTILLGFSFVRPFWVSNFIPIFLSLCTWGNSLTTFDRFRNECKISLSLRIICFQLYYPNDKKQSFGLTSFCFCFCSPRVSCKCNRKDSASMNWNNLVKLSVCRQLTTLLDRATQLNNS